MLTATPTYDPSMSAGEDFADHLAACPVCTPHLLCSEGARLEQAEEGADETAKRYAHRALAAIGRMQ